MAAARKLTHLQFGQQQWLALKRERATWDPHWQEISEYQNPRMGRFLVSDRNRGEERHNSILDNTATRAGRIYSAGMMSGASNPASPYYNLAVADPDRNRNRSVRRHLDTVKEIINRLLYGANTYQVLPAYYEEHGRFGTAGGLLLSDPEHVIWHYPQTVGQYCLATNPKGRVDTYYREFQLTAGQMVAEYGYERCSREVQQAFDDGNLQEWFTVVHGIEPRRERQPFRMDNMHMPFRSLHFEPGTETDPQDLLREGGYELFPALTPRWMVTPGDVYGHCPGMESLGDTRQLQHEQLRKANGIDAQTQPALQGPSSMSGDEIDWEPNGFTPVDGVGQNAGVRPLFESRIELRDLREDILDVRSRINASYFADLFLMLYQADKNMTAHEVAVRHSEKLLMLGPVLQAVNDELLEPMIVLTYHHAEQAGLIPPPPPELGEEPIEIEFVSMLAQAQKVNNARGIDRYVQTIGALRELDEEVVDKLNVDAIADEYADVFGVPARAVRSNREIEGIRNARNQRAAAHEAAELQATQAGSTRDLSAALQNAPDAVAQFSGLAAGV